MDPSSDESASLWDLHCDLVGIPRDTPMPTSLDAKRAEKNPDGVLHCGQCGGIVFRGTLVFTADGVPANILAPQTCVGCGELREAAWPTS